MSVRKDFDAAVAAHQAATGHWETARARLGDGPAAELSDRQRRLITQLAQAATVVTPGMLGRALTDVESATLAEATADQPLAVRIGECVGDADSRFPVVVNLLGTGHVVIDGAASDDRVRSLVQSIPLRLLATRPSDSLSVSFVDPSGSVFADFAPLLEAGYIPQVATDTEGLSTGLTQADEQLTRAARTGGSGADLPERLIVHAGIPEGAGAAVERLGRLASTGPAARLHLVLAGWPGPAIDNATYISVTPGRVQVAGVPLPVSVDRAPSGEVVRGLCARLAEADPWSIKDIPQ